MIACDTSAPSFFLRRGKHSLNITADAVEELIISNKLALFGIVRQKILSGIKHPAQFDRIELTTSALPLYFANEDDHTLASQFFNLCRAKGIQGSPIDFLICAMAVNRKFQIYTTDPGFNMYAPFIPIELYTPPQ